MDFNTDLLRLSHNGQFIMYEDTLYDISCDKSFKITNTNIHFWLNFLKENSKESYKNKITSLINLQSVIRETVYYLSEIFDRETKEFFILEFEKKFSNNLIIETIDTELTVNNISSSWDYVIESISKYITLNEQSEDQGFFSKLKNKISAGTDWLMSKGLGWFFENLRKALFSWGGAAVQVFLATSTGGVGNIILVVVWGAMLAWDLLQGINGNWDWINIIIDLVGVVTTGPGAKIIGGIFQKLGLIGSKLPLSGIIQKISTAGSSTANWFLSIVKKIISGISTIGSYMLQGVSWLSKKLGIKSLEKVSGQLKSKLKGVVDTISKSSATLKTKAGSASSSVKQGLSNVRQSSVGKALSSKPGQIATAAATTYGLTSAFDGDTRVFAGAFGDNNQQQLSQSNSNSEDDLSGFFDDIEFEL